MTLAAASIRQYRFVRCAASLLFAGHIRRDDRVGQYREAVACSFANGAVISCREGRASTPCIDCSGTALSSRTAAGRDRGGADRWKDCRCISSIRLFEDGVAGGWIGEVAHIVAFMSRPLSTGGTPVLVRNFTWCRRMVAESGIAVFFQSALVFAAVQNRFLFVAAVQSQSN